MTKHTESNPFMSETYFIGPVKIEPALLLVTLPGFDAVMMSARRIEALALLAQNYGSVVPQDELAPILSPVTALSDNKLLTGAALRQHFTEIRKSLGDNANHPKYIKTIRGKGLQLLCEPTFEPPVQWDHSPYRGLRSFDYQHAPIFFGRSRDTASIIDTLHRGAKNRVAFVLITGSGGVGKSSLMRAGVLPQLCGAEPALTARWRSAVFHYRAGTGDLFDELAEAVLTAFPELLERISGARFIANSLRSAPAAADRALLAMVGDGVVAASQDGQVTDTRIGFALAIDQIEEILTAPTLNPHEIEMFFQAVEALARSGWCYVMGSVRIDYAPQCLEHSVLGQLADDGRLYTVRAPSIGALREMVTEPARLKNLTFEVDSSGRCLSDTIIQDACPSPESLASLGFSLEQLYQHRAGETLTHSQYRALGGLHGCLAQRCEYVFATLSNEAKQSLGSVLARLATVTKSYDQAIVAKAALWRDVTVAHAAHELVVAFLEARLLSVSRDLDGARIVRLAHESVLKSWARARRWVLLNQDLLQIQAKTARDAREWQNNDRHPDFLLPKGRLFDASKLIENNISLPEHERSFVEASLARAASNARRERRRRRYVLLGATTVAALCAISAVLAIVAWRTSEAAQAAQVEATVARTESRAISDTVAFLFEQAAPYNSGSKDMTALQLLDGSIERLKEDTSLATAERAALLRAMGRAYFSFGEHARAAELLQLALESRQAQQPTDPLRLAETMLSLGWTLTRYGAWGTPNRVGSADRGLELIRESTTLLRNSGPQAHLDLARTLTALSQLQIRRHQYDDAEKAITEALRLRASVLGAQHPGLANAKSTLGYVRIGQGRHADAEALFREALKATETHAEPDNPKLIGHLEGLAMSLQNTNRQQEAVALYRRSLQIGTAAYGRIHPSTAITQNKLGYVLTHLGQFEPAKAVLAEAVDTATTLLSPEHPDLAKYRINLADVLSHTGDAEQARRLAQLAIEVLPRNDSATAPLRATGNSILGVALAIRGECDEATALMLDAVTQLKEVAGIHPQRFHQAEARLARASTACPQP